MSFLTHWFRKKKSAELEARLESREPKPKGAPEITPTRGSEEQGSVDVAHGGRVGLNAALLRAPHITEKAAHLESEGTYVFRVAPFATAHGVAQAVYAAYGVKPVRVNMVRVRGKKVRWGRIVGRRSMYKKAYVTLPPGKKIEIHQGT